MKLTAKVLLALSLFLAPALGLADQITFSFVATAGNSVDMTASALGGLQAGPGDNIAVSDTTLGEHFAQPGTFTSSTGPASSFSIGSSFIVATFTAGGTDSVEIVDGSSVLVAGTMNDNGAFFAPYPGGSGFFGGTFTVTEVSPAILAEFGLSGFNSNGSLSFTFGQDTLKSGVVGAVVGGGTVTIEGSAIPEPSMMLLVGTGILMLAEIIRRRQSRP